MSDEIFVQINVAGNGYWLYLRQGNVDYGETAVFHSLDEVINYLREKLPARKESHP